MHPCSYAKKHFFDRVDTIDIMDVNAGDHGHYFATNFDAEINFREFTEAVWTRIDRQWVKKEMRTERRSFDFPIVRHDGVATLQRLLAYYK